jgi:phosphatidylglycerol lysyltransferase
MKHKRIILKAISYGVVINGLLIIAGTLARQLNPHSAFHVNEVLISLPLISGLTLLYLGTLLNRRKYTAWMIAVPLYGFILGSNIAQLATNSTRHPTNEFRGIFLPLIVVSALIIFRKVFTVKSDIRSFTLSLRISALILLVTLVYGTMGYLLLDSRDFHTEITPLQAVHHTVDQFDFTTDKTLQPYTRRAQIFVDTLNVMTTVALGYAVISLFQPIRAKFVNETAHRQRMLELLSKYSTNSEDFFKLWPHDKNYYFDDIHTQQAALAYHVQRGVALVVGGPVGSPKAVKNVLRQFNDLCTTNDWLPAFVQIGEENRSLYEKEDLELQKIGEEAIVDIAHFNNEVKGIKYFRQIANKFNNHGYTNEVLQPPHSTEVLARLQAISTEWLSLPGRQERGFMMGYYNQAYIQQCNVLVARDNQGLIQGFINQVPTYRGEEANYDMLRQSPEALGNANDYLMMSFIAYAKEAGFKRVNLGLSPLTGIGKEDKDKSIIDSTLRFAYANGDRFYSFSGLHRFKSKYEPEWRDRYIAYKGGVRNFSRALYALNRALSRLK